MMVDLKPAEIDLDPILEEAGKLGWHQIKIYLLLILPVIFASMHADNFIFSAPEVDYRCKVAGCDGPGTEFEPPWLENAIPKGDKCSIFEMRNITNSSRETCDHIFDPNSREYCTEFVYRENNTFIEEMDIACESWKRTLLGTVNNLGTLFALPIIGYISDRYGRKSALIFSCVMESILGTIKALSVNYNMYLAMGIIEPTLGSGAYSSSYILGVEILLPSTRVLGGIIVSVYFSIGQMTMALIAWAFPYWRTFLLIIYIPAFFMFVLHWLIDDTPRWMLSKKKYTRLLNYVKKAAKTNGKEIPVQLLKNLQYNADNESSFTDVKNTTVVKDKPYREIINSKGMILRSLKCSFWWITCTFCFYGMSINAVTLPGNRYTNFIFTSVVEILGHVQAYFGLTYLGRKKSLLSGFLIAGVACFSFAVIPEDLGWLSLIAYLLGKLFITAAFDSVYLYTSELFPTTLRHSMLAFCSMVGRIGSISAPQTPLLGEVMVSLPTILFGSTCIISALLLLSSPETNDVRLPETVKDAVNISELKIAK